MALHKRLEQRPRIHDLHDDHGPAGQKGLLIRRREGKADYYAPKYGRDEYMTLRASAEVEDLVSQYGDVALSHFAEQMAKLDPAPRRALQRLARKP